MITPSQRPMLEVIVLTAADARAAEEGGADRLEVVQAIEVGGMTPTVATVQEIRAATSLPLRVMMRPNAGYTVTPDELALMCAQVGELKAVGADAFVCGILNAGGDLDLPAMHQLLTAIAPAPWTFHRVFDHLPDVRVAWQHAVTLGADLILSSGAPADLPVGLSNLVDRASWQTPTLHWLAGGGLLLDQIPTLLAAGIRQFHTGRAVRQNAQWGQPIDVAAVQEVRQLLDQ